MKINSFYWLAILLIWLLCHWPSAHAQTNRVLPHTPVKDQASSSTCWCFGTLSFVESELMRMGKGKADLSEMYLVRYLLLQKAIMHVRMRGFNFYTPGGQPHDVMNAIAAIGLMTEQAYSGIETGRRSHNHARMDTALAHYILPIATNKNYPLPSNWMSEYQQIIDKYLGVPPDTFDILGKRYAPDSYARSLEFDPSAYVEITSYTHHPYFKWFVLEDCYNWSMASYFNVPYQDYVRLIDTALASGFTIVYNGDVSDTTIDWDKGINTDTETLPMNVITRQYLFDTHQTTIDHVMHIVGDTVFNGQRYFVTKNSWGSIGDQNGFVWFTPNFLYGHMVSLMVHRDALPANIRLRLEETELNR